MEVIGSLIQNIWIWYGLGELSVTLSLIQSCEFIGAHKTFTYIPLCISDSTAIEATCNLFKILFFLLKKKKPK